MSPYERFYGIPTHTSHFKGCGVWAYAVSPQQEKNHAPKAEQGVFVGYSERKIGGYKVYLPKGNEIIESAHVRCGTSPTRTSGELEEIERIDLSFLGRDLLRTNSNNSPVTVEQSAPLTAPNVILKDSVCQVGGGKRRQGRAQGSHRPPVSSSVPVLAHSNASPGGTATLIPHVGPGVTRKIDTTGDGTTVTAHARDRNGSTAGTYHDTVRIDEMTLSDNERERTDHPQPDLSQRPVLSVNRGNIYSTPVKDMTAMRSRLWEVERLSPEEREVSRVSHRQKEDDVSLPDRDAEGSTKRPRDESEGCPHPINMLNRTGAKKSRDISESDQYLMDASESDPIHMDESEGCPRPNTSSPKTDVLHLQDVSESGQHLLGTSESDPTHTDDSEGCPRPTASNERNQQSSSVCTDVSESDQHLVGASESVHTLVRNVATRKEQDVSESDQHLKGTSESDHTLEGRRL